MKLASALFVIAAAVVPQLAGQTFDKSGNNLLQGTSYFREVFWVPNTNSGVLTQAVSIYGTINFDGNGNYNISGASVYDTNVGAVQSFSITGTYTISASGFGFMDNPLSKGEAVFGFVSRGIFVGSSTETTSGFRDMFIAAPLASPLPTNSSFNGSYTVAHFDTPTGSPGDTRESVLQLNPDGNGKLGTVSATGFIAGNGNSSVSQSLSNVTYNFSNGGINLSLGGSLTTSNLIAGTKFLYLSADGSFLFGGSPTGQDMLVGVRSGGSAPNFTGLYYQAGVYQDESQLANGFADMGSFFGAFKPNAGAILGHLRLLTLANSDVPYDYTYGDTYTSNSDGTFDDTTYHFILGSGGTIGVGLGNPPAFGITAIMQPPSFPPTGVFIDPTGVVNAASSGLFTSGIAPGEFISIYGTNLAPSLQVGTNFPPQLGGVQVLVNNRPAPIYFVSKNQISAVVPFGTTEAVAAIQVSNNGILSNTVTSYVNLTAPGVFTNPVGGLGYAAALHADFSLVTTSKPAAVGETISVFLTGLGAVNPAVSDGTPGPVNPFSVPTNSINAFIDGQKATTSFVGLAPTLIGLYQINVTIPTAVHSGDVFFDVSGPDFYTSESLLSILPGGGTVGVNDPATAAKRQRRPVLPGSRQIKGLRRLPQ